MIPGADRNRLRWRCRRGLLELDLLLGRFLDERYDELAERERRAFELALEVSDQTLLGWLSGTEQPADEAIRNIVRKISQ